VCVENSRFLPDYSQEFRIKIQDSDSILVVNTYVLMATVLKR
jgi:hypothetical protein